MARGLRGRRLRRAAAAVAADGLRRGDAALRLRQARHALRPRDRRRRRGAARHASSRSSSRSLGGGGVVRGAQRRRARDVAHGARRRSPRSSSATAARRSRVGVRRGRRRWRSPIAKFLGDERARGGRRGARRRSRGRPAAVRRRPAARWRPRRSARCGSSSARRFGLIPEGRHDVLWVVDFPMFECERGRARWDARAPPVHRARRGDFADPGAMRSRALRHGRSTARRSAAGRSVSTRPEVQQQVFKVIGMTEEEGRRRFGFLLDALQLRRAAARRHRARHRPHRGADRRPRLDPRRHRVPEDEPPAATR